MGHICGYCILFRLPSSVPALPGVRLLANKCNMALTKHYLLSTVQMRT